MHWAATNGSASIIEFLRDAGARSTIEAIEGWISDSVFIFHHNNYLSVSRQDAKSELAAKRSNSSSAAMVESIDDERKISPGIWQNGCCCDGCLLVSFDLNNLLISSSDINRTYTVRVISVRNAQNLTTVSNAKTRQIKPILVTGLRNWNERESQVRAFYESLSQEELGKRGAARKYVQKPHFSNRFYWIRFPAPSFVVCESCRRTINPEIYEFDKYMTIMTLQRKDCS